MNHKNLDAWKEAMTLVDMVYEATGTFPKAELFGLALQTRRSAVSIPSNISEGAGRNSKRELLNFLNYALGSLAELETQLIIAERQKYLNSEHIMEQLISVRSLMLGLRNRIRKD